MTMMRAVMMTMMMWCLERYTMGRMTTMTTMMMMMMMIITMFAGLRKPDNPDDT